MAAHKLTLRRACDAVGLSRAGWYRPGSDALERGRELDDALIVLAGENRRWGFWKIYARLRLDGHRWNHKRVLRVYRQLLLNRKRRTRKRIPMRVRRPLEPAPIANEVWTLDFMHDALYVGRRLRTLNVLADGVL